MKLTTFTRAFCAVLFLGAAPAFADGFMVHDAYLRSSTPKAPSGAAFMVLMNHSGSDDRLVGVASDAAERVELHRHIEGDDGVMRMTEIEDGIPIPNAAAHGFRRGGDHLMFMGLTRTLTQGDMVKVTLIFEVAGEIEIELPVDHDRKPDHGGLDHTKMDHSGHDATHGKKTGE